MTALSKGLKWFAIEYAKTFAVCALIAIAIGVLMTFIAYPVQTITFVIVAIIVYAAWAFVFGR